jgi:hypothetical protein
VSPDGVLDPVLNVFGIHTHYSIYPSTGPLVAAFEKALEPYEVNGKGTIRFPLSQPVPVKLIEGLAKFRAKEVIAERASARADERRTAVVTLQRRSAVRSGLVDDIMLLP